MVNTTTILQNLTKIRNLSSVARRDFTAGRIYFNKPAGGQQARPSQGSGPSAPLTGNVPGLSEAVYTVPNEPVGPGASKSSKDYKNPEYFCYDKTSYYEAEIEMLSYRLPQPNNHRKP